MLHLNIPNFQTVPVKRGAVEWQISILGSLARSYINREHLFTKLERVIEVTPKKAIVHAHNNEFTNYLIKWALIFGSPRSNRTHWENILIINRTTNLVPTKIVHADYVNAVLGHIRSYDNVASNTFKLARKNVKKARDRFGAHIDVGRIPEMPDLRHSFTIAKAYSALLTRLQEENDFLPPQSIAEREEFYEEEAQLLFPGY